MGLLRWLFGDSGSDGSSPAKAIVVSSVGEEYVWIQRRCPGFQVGTQWLQEIDGKPYDVLEIHNQRGDRRLVYFDISRFYGGLRARPTWQQLATDLGQKLAAIRAYREEHGGGMAEAKQAIEAFLAEKERRP